VEHEGELVVVIGKRGRHITAENAKKHILGYTIGNDVTARDLQKSDGQWTRAKGFDTFCPFGPWIDTEFDPADAVVTCRVNGQMRQMASTRDMVFNVGVLIAYISSVMTLEPGDLIFTGTPAGVGELKEGDEVSVEIEGLGLIKNKVGAVNRGSTDLVPCYSFSPLTFIHAFFMIRASSSMMGLSHRIRPAQPNSFNT
jgi:2-keto-4-pentenoate hydratase/2-oxohepta-3-ene-1,7-dioic acid hydratase in catechol pathway